MRWILAALLLSVLAAGIGGCSGSGSDSSVPPSGTTGSYTVTGTVRYEDVEYGQSGQTGKTTMKPVRLAELDLLDAGGAILATITADDSGQFLFPTVTTQPATIRILAEATSTFGTKVAIRSASGGGYWAATYGLSGKDLTQPQSVDIIRDSKEIAGVFNMLDVYLSGLEYASSQFAPSNPLPTLNVYWPNSGGTYTCNSGCPFAGPAIYVLDDYMLGIGTDQDQYDDDVLWHELAHYFEFSLGVSDSPGGMHTFTDNTLDLALSWSEGHADYFQTAIKRWLSNYHPVRLSIDPLTPVTYYVDTQNGVGSQFVIASMDLANPGGTPYMYATNEAAVAKVVWSTSETYGEPAIWSAWTSYMPGITYRARSLETFWDGLILQAGLVEGQLLPIFAERQINYSGDSYETDNTVGMRPAVDCTAVGTCVNNEAHTLYTLYQPAQSPERDIVPIKVTAGLTYTISTGNMTNGADTYMRLLDINGNVVLDGSGVPIENDDIPSVTCWNGTLCNNGTNFSSRIVYSPTANGTLNVEVSNAPYAQQIAGAYGGYTLTINAK